jgi:hypothetical protein
MLARTSLFSPKNEHQQYIDDILSSIVNNHNVVQQCFTTLDVVAAFMHKNVTKDIATTCSK